jgi:hypothetical protein
MASKIIVDQLEKTGGALAALTLPVANATANQYIKNDGAGALSWASLPESGLFSGYALFADQKTQNTGGGTFTLGAWRQRDLNTTIANTDTTNIVLGTNQFTLLAGSYFIQWQSPAHYVEANQTRLYDVTGAASVAVGTSAYTFVGHPAYAYEGPSKGVARVTPSGSTVYRIEHYSSGTMATTGFGFQSNIDTEQYTTVSIFKEL